MAQIHTLDLTFHADKTIASYLIESSEGPILVETGPHSTFERLKEACGGIGVNLPEIRHVLLTHIHFDHAGAAWALAENGARIYVHPLGYKHLKDPTRLYNSAKLIYKDQMEVLWGRMEKIPESQLEKVDHEAEIVIGEHKFGAWHTPGHARHHIAWQLGTTIFTGDVGGVAIFGGPVTPPCPPPDIDLEAWVQSINLLRSLNPQELYLTHFGKISDVHAHLDDLEKILKDWADFILQKMKEGLNTEEIAQEFGAYTHQQLLDRGMDEAQVHRYSIANPAIFSVSGLMRYWTKKQRAT